MNIGGVNTVNQLNRTFSTMQKSINNIATGSKLSSAANDPAGYAISQRMQANLGAIHQSNVNTQTTNSMMKTAAGAVDNTVDALKSLKETVLNAANGTNTKTDTGDLQKAFDQTVAQINDNANVQYNGMNLLDGSKGSIAVAGVDGYDNVSLGDMSAKALGLVDGNGKSTVDLSSLDNEEAIGAALDTIDNALSMATAQQNNINGALDEATDIGAFQQGLDYQSANYTTMEENLTYAESTIADTDIAAEVTKLKSAETQNQLALYATKMQMQDRAGVLKLLQ